jgi:dipeptidyl aminopeptidase/acylaminoacyl peptidase
MRGVAESRNSRMKTRLSLCLPLVALLTLQANSLAATPAGVSIPHPDDASKRVEYFLEKPSGAGPWPTIVLLHGHQDGKRPGGKDFVDWGVLKPMADRGYLAVAVSQPGYGNSTGPADYCGPFTQHAVSAVIAKLREAGLASPEKLVILGISRGALTAGMIAAEDPAVSGLVLISGIYDLPAYVADARENAERTAIAHAIVAETGGAEEALQARSALHVAKKIKASTLILNGAKDPRTSADQARRLAERISQNGNFAKALIYPEYGHQIPVDIRNKDINPFIDLVLRSDSNPQRPKQLPSDPHPPKD